MEKFINFLGNKYLFIVSALAILVSLVEHIGVFDIHFAYDPAIITVFISGVPIAYYAFYYLFKERIITSALLITIAIIAAISIGETFAAGEVAFIMAIGEWLEHRTVQKTRKGIEKLLEIVPSQGRKLTVDSIGKKVEVMVPAEELNLGDVIRILPGESIPGDCEILSGETTVNQAVMTGESLPVDKVEGDQLFSGTINCFGTVDAKITKVFADSSLQKMISLIQDAENKKAPMQKIVDKWAGYLVPLACSISIFVYVLLRYILTGYEDVALIRAVTILIVFCPCALALATPTSIVAAIGQATKTGVLIKSGEALENMGAIDTVAFDKTGTITTGKLHVSNVYNYNCELDDLMKLVVAAESKSEHPLGKAIVAHAKEAGVDVSNIENFKLIVGKGVLATVDGKDIICGNEKLINENSTADLTGEMESLIGKLRGEGKAIIIVADANSILGIIALEDTIKETSVQAIKNLSVAGINKTVLLTGDNEKSANYIAGQVGITNVYASLLPEDKVAAIQELSSGDKKVCMVGDGVNDAPALKIASVGVAMGTMGSDIAIDAADIAIMGDDISKIGYLKRLSNATVNTIKFNITMSMCLNLIAVVGATTGFIGPVLGAIFHNIGSVLVTLNAARLYDRKI